MEYTPWKHKLARVKHYKEADSKRQRVPWQGIQVVHRKRVVKEISSIPPWTCSAHAKVSGGGSWSIRQSLETNSEELDDNYADTDPPAMPCSAVARRGCVGAVPRQNPRTHMLLGESGRRQSPGFSEPCGLAPRFTIHSWRNWNADTERTLQALRSTDSCSEKEERYGNEKLSSQNLRKQESIK